jgi:hypothetical protein
MRQVFGEGIRIVFTGVSGVELKKAGQAKTRAWDI